MKPGSRILNPQTSRQMRDVARVKAELEGATHSGRLRSGRRLLLKADEF